MRFSELFATESRTTPPAKRKRKENKRWGAPLEIFLLVTHPVMQVLSRACEAGAARSEVKTFVVAAIQPQHSEDLQAPVQKLEFGSTHDTVTRGAGDRRWKFVLRRSPQVCVIDRWLPRSRLNRILIAGNMCTNKNSAKPSREGPAGNNSQVIFSSAADCLADVET